MQIANHSVVSIEYTLKDDDGNILDSSDNGEPLTYLHGVGNIIPGLEDALAGKTQGEELSVTVSPEEGYGQHNEQLTQVVSRDIFDSSDTIEVGTQFHGQSDNGSEQPIIITITKIDGDNITIDGNHPLAGINLNFDVKIIEVRAATEVELEHGHAHGSDGHHHD